MMYIDIIHLNFYLYPIENLLSRDTISKINVLIKEFVKKLISQELRICYGP